MEMFNQSIYPYPVFVSSTNDHHSSYYHPDNNNPTNAIAIERSNRCLVCHDRASGIHFGVSTCEACKAFFRRTNLSNYSMANPCSPNRCEINIKNRNNCPSCRFDKCKRLGMDRDNVIYGKPSKQHNQTFYQQDHYLEQLTNIFNDLMKIFSTIQSIDNKQQIETFGNLAYQLFYEQTSSNNNNNNSSDVIHRIYNLLFNSDKTNLIFDYHLNLRAILSLWLFVYYYETFIHKQKISEDKLTILIKLLDIESNKIQQYYNKSNIFRIDFLNTFTKFADLLQEIYSDN